MHKRALLPFFVSLSRILALPFALNWLGRGDFVYAFAILGLCGIGDLLDGFVARRLRVESELGGFCDATADFILLSGVFLFFASEGIYPLLIPLLMLFMFAQFAISSLLSKLVYDPVGKHFGTLLYAAAAITLAFPTELICVIFAVSITICTVLSFVSRIAYFIGILPTDAKTT